jgi:Tfp pilus assembly protein PilF
MSIRLWAVALLLLLLPLHGQALARPNNEMPLYGGGPVPPELATANDEFIDSILKRGVTRAQGSDNMVSLGWRYFFERKDIATAMKRFNQAWLLDPDNGDAFHGFAILVMARDADAPQADSLFQQGLAKPRQSPGIYLDYGRFLLTVNRPADAVPQLRKALTFADMGPDAEALLTLALNQSGEKEAACAESAKVQDKAQQPIRDAARAVCGQR